MTFVVSKINSLLALYTKLKAVSISFILAETAFYVSPTYLDEFRKLKSA